MPDIKKAGIVIDEWKLSIFKRHLEQASYTFKHMPFTEDTVLLHVHTTNLEALKGVLQAAAAEAEKSRGAKP